MDKKSTTFGLSSEKLVEVFKIGRDAAEAESEPDIDQKKAELLQDRLGETLMLDLSLVESMPIIPKHLKTHAPGLLANEMVGDLLQNPKAEISLLRSVKNYYNKLSTAADSEIEHDTAIAIYYAAIAGALVFHDRKITRFSYEDLEKSYSALMDKCWMPSKLTKLFGRACKVCQEVRKEVPESKKHKPGKNKK